MPPKRNSVSYSQSVGDTQEESITFDEIHSMIEEANRLVALANKDIQRKASLVDCLGSAARPVKIRPFQSTVGGITSAKMAPPTKKLTATESKRHAQPKSPPNAALDLEIERINQYCRNVHRDFASPNNGSGRLVNTVRLPQTPDPLMDTVASLSAARPRESAVDLRSTRSNQEPEAIIDLSNYNSPLPLRRRLNFDSSDVTYVLVDEVVDLCSPTTNLTHRFGDRGNEGAAVGNKDSDKNKCMPELQPKASAAANRASKLTCPVCMESAVERQPTSTKCGHVFCGDCISEAIRITHKCPMCNKKLSQRMVFRIYV